MIPLQKFASNTQAAQQSFEPLAVEVAGVVCARSVAERIDQIVVGNQWSLPTQVTPQFAADHEDRITPSAGVVGQVPVTVRTRVTSASTSVEQSMTLIERLGRVVPHHAVARQRKPCAGVPSCSLLVVRERSIHPQYRHKSHVAAVAAVIPTFIGAIGNDIARTESWSELPCSAETRDQRELMLEIGLPTNRAVHKGWDTIRLRGFTTCRRGHQGNVRIDIDACHTHQGTSGSNV